MSAEILDLDSISPIQKKIAIGGKEYPIKAISIREFINITRETQEMAKKAEEGKLTAIDQMEANLKIVGRAIPDMPEEVLNTLNLDHLQAIINFVQNAAVEEAPEEAKGNE